MSVEQVTQDPIQQAQILFELATLALESSSDVDTTVVSSELFAGMSQAVESILHTAHVAMLKKNSGGTWSKPDAQAAKTAAEATFDQASRFPSRWYRRLSSGTCSQCFN